MRTIAVVNQKGGCGKTITAINLSAFLALAGRRVLLVDMDPQGHSTLGLPAGDGVPSRTMYDVFLSRIRGSDTTLADVTRPVGENFDLAPADILLSAVPEALAGAPGRENVLAWALARMDGRYDYVIVDCPPNVGLLTFNALKACNEAVIPMDPSFFSLHGIGKLFETFDLLERETGHRISARVLVTLYPGRTPFVRAVVDEVHRHLPGRHFATVVRQSVKLAEAASHGLPITRYARYSAGFEDYQALAGEVLEQEVSVAAAEDLGSATAPGVTPDGVVFTVEAPNAAPRPGRGRLQRLEARQRRDGAGRPGLEADAQARARALSVPLRDRRPMVPRSPQCGRRAEPVRRRRLAARARGAASARTGAFTDG